MRIQHTSVLFFVTLMTAACAGGPISIPTGGTTTPGGGGATTPSSGNVANDVVRYTNDARARNGLPRLAANAKLMEAARIQAGQMAKYQRADHTISGAQYPSMQSRLNAVGYNYSNAAENVAWNQRDAATVVNTWMNSRGHRANILDPSLREIGAAMVRSSKGEPYWAQVFGTPR